MRHFAISAMFLALMGVGPALAGSQSSNSSSNCSNGHCSRVESFVTDDGRFSRGYFRRDVWHEGAGRWRESRHDDRHDRWERDRWERDRWQRDRWERDRWERRYRGDRRGRDDDDD